LKGISFNCLLEQASVQKTGIPALADNTALVGNLSIRRKPWFPALQAIPATKTKKMNVFTSLLSLFFQHL
jgi:hypothetical protein